MLIIRQEQMDTLSRAAVHRFERALLEDLRKNYPAESELKGDAGVLALIREASKRGESLGIVAECDIATLAELDLSLGAPFERQKGNEWAVAILRDKSISPAGRLALILARLPAA
ncbi:MAG TPA: hypothetical protein PKX00_15430 [Opitutaceae bacterium]|jgi:hypothetical protein|nr:hypothetical protein [Opitutaceae bacterium]HRE07004.1 hypothetical protein [Opitutaceae bacterium]